METSAFAIPPYLPLSIVTRVTPSSPASTRMRWKLIAVTVRASRASPKHAVSDSSTFSISLLVRALDRDSFAMSRASPVATYSPPSAGVDVQPGVRTSFGAMGFRRSFSIFSSWLYSSSRYRSAPMESTSPDCLSPKMVPTPRMAMSRSASLNPSPSPQHSSSASRRSCASSRMSPISAWNM